jgi:hypothetical protein
MDKAFLVPASKILLFPSSFPCLNYFQWGKMHILYWTLIHSPFWEVLIKPLLISCNHSPGSHARHCSHVLVVSVGKCVACLSHILHGALCTSGHVYHVSCFAINYFIWGIRMDLIDATCYWALDRSLRCLYMGTGGALVGIAWAYLSCPCQVRWLRKVRCWLSSWLVL